MNYRKLGPSDVEVSELGLGCAALGGLNWVKGRSHGWPEVDDDTIAEAVKVALDSGVTHFDCADLYGNGEAERRLSRVLERLGANADALVISSKVGFLQGSAPHPFDPFHIRQQCEQSLRNLRRDHIDLYYLHNAEFGEDDIYLEPAAETLDALVQEGKVRLKGQSAYTAQDFEKTVPVVRPDVLQSRANLLDDRLIHPGSTVSDLLKQEKLSFIAFSPLAVGLLTGRFDPKEPPAFDDGDNRRHSPLFKPDFLAKVKQRLGRVRSRFGGSKDDLSAVALRFVLSHRGVASVIPGFQNADEVRANLGVTQQSFDVDDIDFLRECFEGLEM
ncbi:MAG: aldo/keto reductase [Opitutales bacterium]